MTKQKKIEELENEVKFWKILADHRATELQTLRESVEIKRKTIQLAALDQAANALHSIAELSKSINNQL